MGDAYKDNLELSIKMSLKFDYFIIGLTFSILALAIQFGVESSLIFPGIAELLGWVFLLVSGIFGLSRLEWRPSYFELGAKIVASKTIVKDLQTAKAKRNSVADRDTLEPMDVNKAIQTRQDTIEKLKKRESELQSAFRWKYQIQKWCFLSGLISLAVSHGYEKALRIF